jgi:branched-chain amino acid transport system ATP-binding protein
MIMWIGPNMAILACRGVSKYFGALAAVNNLSFDVEPGEVLGIGGPNGAGKTTLFDIISGLTPADGGELVFDGHSLMGRAADTNCHLGLARTFQLNAGFDTMTVRENVLVAAYYGYQNVIFPKLRYDRESRRRADEALDLVGLRGSADVVVRYLPVYHRKLLMLAGALASYPKLLLMDEPVGGLNPHEIDDILGIVERVRQNRSLTIIIIEHVMRFLVALSSRVMIMHHGEKIYEGSTEGLARDTTVVEVYLGKGASKRLGRILAGQTGGD